MTIQLGGQPVPLPWPDKYGEHYYTPDTIRVTILARLSKRQLPLQIKCLNPDITDCKTAQHGAEAPKYLLTSSLLHLCKTKMTCKALARLQCLHCQMHHQLSEIQVMVEKVARIYQVGEQTYGSFFCTQPQHLPLCLCWLLTIKKLPHIRRRY